MQVGLNYNTISQEITDTKIIIWELRRKENNILKILKNELKDMNSYVEYNLSKLSLVSVFFNIIKTPY